MNLPRFSAEMALGKPSQSYRSNQTYFASGHGQPASSLSPSQFAEELGAGDSDADMNGNAGDDLSSEGEAESMSESLSDPLADGASEMDDSE